MKPSIRRFFVFGMILGILLPSVVHAQTRARAAFEPSSISLGQQGVYSVVIPGVQEVPQIPPPAVDGLAFGDTPSLSQMTNIINGSVSIRATLSWPFVAQKEGTFTVPARTVDLGGESLYIPETSVSVTPLSEREKNILRLEWELPDPPYYVGEAIPVILKLHIADGIQVHPVRGTLEPEKIGDGFLASEFTDLTRRSPEKVGTVTYDTYARDAVLTPIRPGSLPLETAMRVVYSDPYNSRYTTDIFGRRQAREQQRVLATEPLQLEIREAPAEGQLEGFNGAVGQFTSSGTLAESLVQAGEPVTLTVSISGTGNFDRIAAPAIPASDDWRVYPPKVSFESVGALGVEGTKRFDYLIVPQSETVTASPRVPFAAFDPDSETYTDLSIEPVPLTVAPAARSEGATVYARAETEPSNEPAPSLDYRANRADLGALHARIEPIFVQPVFLASQAGLGVAFVGLFFWLRRRDRFVQDEAYARQVLGSKSVRQWAKQASDAVAAKDTIAFYAAAQRALQESAGRLFPRSRRAESLTHSEIEAVLLERGVSESARETVRAIFQTGDALRYAGSSAVSEETLQEHAAQLEGLLRELHKALS